MDFRSAANILGAQISTAEMAAELGVSSHSVRQARLLEGSPGYRNPPRAWRTAFARLATARIQELEQLLQALDTDNSSGPGFAASRVSVEVGKDART